MMITLLLKKAARYSVLVVVFLLSFGKAISQTNIVPNSGFETFSSCPNFGAQWDRCVGWNNVNMNLGVGPWGTPDYFTACGTGGTAPPATFAGNCNPHTGNAMMALVVYNMGYANYREYLSTALNCTMFPGNTYTVSFWITNGTSGISPWCIRNFGIHFSSAPLSQSGYGVISAVPQCEVTSNIYSTSWVQYTFTVNPSSNWTYLTIGAFQTDAMNNYSLAIPNPGGPPSAYANYFIDDIEVLGPPTGSGNLVISSSTGNFSVCPGQTLALQVSGAPSYTWSTGSSASSITLAPVGNTVISVQAPGGSCSSNNIAQVTVGVLPNPTINTIGTNTLCTRTTITITASGADTYQWSSGQQGAQIIVLPLTTTVYTVTGTNTLSGCSSSAIHLVSVSSTPTLSVFGTPVACIGSQVTYSALGATVLNWSSGGTGPVTSFIPVAPGLYTLTGINGGLCQASTTFSINLVECLGLEEAKRKGEFSLFPSPVTAELNIILPFETQIEELAIYDLMGKRLKVIHDVKPLEGKIDLELTDLATGIYLLRVKTGNDIFEKRFSKL